MFLPEMEPNQPINQVSKKDQIHQKSQATSQLIPRSTGLPNSPFRKDQMVGRRCEMMKSCNMILTKSSDAKPLKVETRCCKTETIWNRDVDKSKPFKRGKEQPTNKSKLPLTYQILWGSWKAAFGCGGPSSRQEKNQHEKSNFCPIVPTMHIYIYELPQWFTWFIESCCIACGRPFPKICLKILACTRLPKQCETVSRAVNVFVLHWMGLYWSFHGAP